MYQFSTLKIIFSTSFLKNFLILNLSIFKPIFFLISINKSNKSKNKKHRNGSQRSVIKFIHIFGIIKNNVLRATKCILGLQIMIKNRKKKFEKECNLIKFGCSLKFVIDGKIEIQVNIETQVKI